MNENAQFCRLLPRQSSDKTRQILYVRSGGTLISDLLSCRSSSSDRCDEEEAHIIFENAFKASVHFKSKVFELNLVESKPTDVYLSANGRLLPRGDDESSKASDNFIQAGSITNRFTLCDSYLGMAIQNVTSTRVESRVNGVITNTIVSPMRMKRLHSVATVPESIMALTSHSSSPKKDLPKKLKRADRTTHLTEDCLVAADRIETETVGRRRSKSQKMLKSSATEPVNDSITSILVSSASNRRETGLLNELLLLRSVPTLLSPRDIVAFFSPLQVCAIYAVEVSNDSHSVKTEETKHIGLFVEFRSRSIACLALLRKGEKILSKITSTGCSSSVNITVHNQQESSGITADLAEVTNDEVMWTRHTAWSFQLDTTVSFEEQLNHVFGAMLPSLYDHFLVDPSKLSRHWSDVVNSTSASSISSIENKIHGEKLNIQTEYNMQNANNMAESAYNSRIIVGEVTATAVSSEGYTSTVATDLLGSEMASNSNSMSREYFSLRLLEINKLISETEELLYNIQLVLQNHTNCNKSEGEFVEVRCSMYLSRRVTLYHMIKAALWSHLCTYSLPRGRKT